MRIETNRQAEELLTDDNHRVIGVRAGSDCYYATKGVVIATGDYTASTDLVSAGLVYVNRDDPALVVGARFGVGWALNYGNAVSWLPIAGCIAWWAGLAALGAVAGI